MAHKALLLSCVAILFETSIAAAQRDEATDADAEESRDEGTLTLRAPDEVGPLRTPIAEVAPYAAGLAAWTTALGIGLYSAPWSDGKVDAGWSDQALIDPNLLADAIGCAIPIATATATGALRMASDSHYFTDVLLGAAVGFASGYLITIAVVPSRVRVPVERDEVAASTGVAWTIVPTASTSRDGATIGAAAAGLF